MPEVAYRAGLQAKHPRESAWILAPWMSFTDADGALSIPIAGHGVVAPDSSVRAPRYGLRQ